MADTAAWATNLAAATPTGADETGYHWPRCGHLSPGAEKAPTPIASLIMRNTEIPSWSAARGRMTEHGSEPTARKADPIAGTG